MEEIRQSLIGKVHRGFQALGKRYPHAFTATSDGETLTVQAHDEVQLFDINDLGADDCQMLLALLDFTIASKPNAVGVPVYGITNKETGEHLPIEVEGFSVTEAAFACLATAIERYVGT
jgi:hypothetical protein